MFHHISGIVTDLAPNLAVIECAGVGFEINTTANTISRLRSGEKAKLYICENIREDVFDLYGFFDKSEKSCFEMLVSVSGVGPKAAISILSTSNPESLAMAIIGGDEKALTVAPGVGKKIAQRILLELKDKMCKETEGLVIGSVPLSRGESGSSKLSDAASALAVLGYSNAEIGLALKDIDIENATLEQTIKLALKKMLK
ncbi:MAG: Holliday junction branch migration protein RuvA [Clostridiales bacterium]|nr:Holliday junction branch migration protein RuvA [Clostridiales bacterium]